MQKLQLCAVDASGGVPTVQKCQLCAFSASMVCILCIYGDENLCTVQHQCHSKLSPLVHFRVSSYRTVEEWCNLETHLNKKGRKITKISGDGLCFLNAVVISLCFDYGVTKDIDDMKDELMICLGDTAYRYEHLYEDKAQMMRQAVEFFMNRDYNQDVVDHIAHVTAEAYDIIIIIYKETQGFIEVIRTEPPEKVMRDPDVHLNKVHLVFHAHPTNPLYNHYNSATKKGSLYEAKLFPKGKNLKKKKRYKQRPVSPFEPDENGEEKKSKKSPDTNILIKNIGTVNRVLKKKEYAAKEKEYRENEETQVQRESRQMEEAQAQQESRQMEEAQAEEARQIAEAEAEQEKWEMEEAQREEERREAQAQKEAEKQARDKAELDAEREARDREEAEAIEKLWSMSGSDFGIPSPEISLVPSPPPQQQSKLDATASKDVHQKKRHVVPPLVKFTKAAVEEQKAKENAWSMRLSAFDLSSPEISRAESPVPLRPPPEESMSMEVDIENYTPDKTPEKSAELSSQQMSPVHKSPEKAAELRPQDDDEQGNQISSTFQAIDDISFPEGFYEQNEENKEAPQSRHSQTPSPLFADESFTSKQPIQDLQVSSTEETKEMIIAQNKQWGKFFPEVAFADMVAEKVEEIPQDIDGKVLFVMECTAATWKILSSDQRHFVMHTSKKECLEGTRKTGVCRGNFECLNDSCPKYIDSRHRNTTNFSKIGSFPTCKICGHSVQLMPCGARKAVEFDRVKKECTVWHIGRHVCSLKPTNPKTKALMKGRIKEAIESGNTLPAVQFARSEVEKKVRAGDFEGARADARLFSDQHLATRIQREVETEVRTSQGGDVPLNAHSFDAVGVQKEKTDKSDKFWIYEVNNSKLRHGTSDYVFKTSKVMAQVAINMDASGDHYLSKEVAFFDAAHKRVKDYKAFALWVYHPKLRRLMRIANMEMEGETTQDIAKFFTLLNEVLQQVKGEAKYKFNPSAFLCDEAGANKAAVIQVYGEAFQHRVFGCQWHFMHNATLKAKVIHDPDTREKFLRTCKKLCIVETVDKYRHYRAILDDISEREKVKDWVQWWDARRSHMFTPFRDPEAPRSNLSESGNFAWQKKKGLYLVDAANDDVATIIQQEEWLKMVDEGEGVFHIGRGKTQKDRKLESRKAQMKRADVVEEIITSRQARELHLDQLLAPSYFEPKDKSRHRPPEKAAFDIEGTVVKRGKKRKSKKFKQPDISWTTESDSEVPPQKSPDEKKESSKSRPKKRPREESEEGDEEQEEAEAVKRTTRPAKKISKRKESDKRRMHDSTLEEQEEVVARKRKKPSTVEVQRKKKKAVFTVEEARQQIISSTSEEEREKEKGRTCLAKGRPQRVKTATWKKKAEESSVPMKLQLVKDKITEAEDVLGYMVRADEMAPPRPTEHSEIPNRPQVMQFPNKLIKKCQGCRVPLQPNTIPPRNMCIRMQGWTGFKNPSGDWVKTKGNLYFHYKMCCLKNYQSNIELEDLEVTREQYTRFTLEHLEELKRAKLLPYLVAHIKRTTKF